jgi:uncharacterized membrane protein YcaP (DUF421 family)/ribosomal protein S27AE
MENYTFDLQRILIGEMPILFFVEIALRTTILFIYTIGMMRLIGHRGLSELSVAELSVIIALGSAVGDPMFYPEIPVIHGMTVVTVVVVLQRLLTLLIVYNAGVGKLMEGEAHRLVVDGMIDVDGMAAVRMSCREIFAELRLKGVRQLGEVQRAYLEQDGEVSIFRFPEDQVRPGLPLIPAGLEAGPTIDRHERPEPGLYACGYCGFTRESNGSLLETCPRCGEDQWRAAAGTNAG